MPPEENEVERNFYCPECGTWFAENQPYCDGPGESAQRHKPAFLVSAYDVEGADA